MTVRAPDVTFLDGRVQLFHGDSRDVLASMQEASVDAIVCDPPYGLTQSSRNGSPRNNDPETPFGRTKLGSRTERGFMGKTWDTGETAFDPAFWVEALRVLKPGGYLVAFSGTRTYHRMACAIEDAGFEIRDQIGWAFGSGFPKSHDVAKAIMKRRTEDVEPIRNVCRFVRAAMDERGLKSRDLTQHFGDCNARLIDHWAARDSDSQPSLPTTGQWVKLREVLQLSDAMDAEVERLNARKGEYGDTWRSADVIGEYEGEPGEFGDHRFSVRDAAIRQLDDLALQWEGWGTALKPAWEPICLARKPLIGTVVENVLTHGTGALNIDGCRIETTENLNGGAYASSGSRVAIPGDERYGAALGMFQAGKTVGKEYAQPLGRFPANVIHDGSDEVLTAFPDVGVSSGGKGAASQATALAGDVYGKYSGATLGQNAGGLGDSGSAARFFYTAKADASDRIGSKHPTVKPVDLMQWLVRLVTPKGGVVLDPFAGTGTTGEAAWREGVNAILIEREAEYQADIARRMELATKPSKRAAVAKTKGNISDLGPLFAEVSNK